MSLHLAYVVIIIAILYTTLEPIKFKPNKDWKDWTRVLFVVFSLTIALFIIGCMIQVAIHLGDVLSNL